MTTCLLSPPVPKERESHVSLKTHLYQCPKYTVCVYIHIRPMCLCRCCPSLPCRCHFGFHWRNDLWSLPRRRTFLAKIPSLELPAMQLLIMWHHPLRFKWFQNIIIIPKSAWSQFCLQIRTSGPRATFWAEIDTQRLDSGNQNSSFFIEMSYIIHSFTLIRPGTSNLEAVAPEWNCSVGDWEWTETGCGISQCCLGGS